MRVGQLAAGAISFRAVSLVSKMNSVLATMVTVVTIGLGVTQPVFADLPDTSQDNFQKDVLSSAKPVVVECNAPWCTFCKKLEPVLSELSKNYVGKASFYQMDIDKNPLLKAKYKIVELPRVIIFQDGKVVNDTLGYRNCQLIGPKIDALVADKK